MLIIHLGLHTAANNCDHVHQSEQFDTASKQVVYLHPTAEVAHILGSFSQN